MAEYISREEAIKELREVYENEYPTASGDFDEYASHDMPNVLRNIPAADVQPVKQWVKLHDKHPDTEGLYLVCDQYGECEVVEYLPDIKSWFTHKIKGEIRYWMPLPEPPKDGEQND